MRHNRIQLTVCVIAMGVCFYLIMIGLAEIAHDHDHHTHDPYTADSHECSACFFSANHVGVALHAESLPYVGVCALIHPPFDPTFVSATTPDNTRSRAPPASAA